MSQIKPRARQNGDLMELILNASKRILISEGYTALSMRRLAREIGYSATTIYLYFTNRDAIVAELGKAGLEVLETYVTPAGEAGGKAGLKEFARQYLRFGVEQPESYRLIFMQGEELADAMFRTEDNGKGEDGAGLRVFALLINCIEQLRMSDLAWRKVDTAKAAEVFWTSIHGIVSLKLTCGKFLQTPGEDLLEHMVLALITGMPAAHDAEAERQTKGGGSHQHYFVT